MNFIETIQKNLGYPPIKKIDPNTSKPIDNDFETGSIAQAAIPVAVLGLFNYIDANRSKPADLNKNHHQWSRLIFADKNSEIISHVAQYAGSTIESTKHEMEFILKEAVRLIKELNSDDTPLHGFTVQHKAEALLYLPVSLHAGIILGNNNLDDNTNKMEGPVSNLMHNIEKRFK